MNVRFTKGQSLTQCPRRGRLMPVRSVSVEPTGVPVAEDNP